MMWNRQSYPVTVLNERMWHFREGLRTNWSSCIFSGDQDPQLPWSTPRPTPNGQRLLPPTRKSCFHSCLSVNINININIIFLYCTDPYCKTEGALHSHYIMCYSDQYVRLKRNVFSPRRKATQLLKNYWPNLYKILWNGFDIIRTPID